MLKEKKLHNAPKKMSQTDMIMIRSLDYTLALGNCFEDAFYVFFLMHVIESDKKNKNEINGIGFE